MSKDEKTTADPSPSGVKPATMFFGKFSDEEIDQRLYVSSVNRDAEQKTNRLMIVASDGSMDRHGEKIDQESWILGPYKKNPVNLWVHDRFYLPIGKAISTEVIKTGRGGRPRLVQVVEFAMDVPGASGDVAEFIQTIGAYFMAGYLNGFSVGAAPYAWEDPNGDTGKRRDGERLPWERVLGRMWKNNELQEVSGCTIPSNRNGTAMRGRGTKEKLDELAKVLEVEASLEQLVKLSSVESDLSGLEANDDLEAIDKWLEDLETPATPAGETPDELDMIDKLLAGDEDEPSTPDDDLARMGIA